MARLILIIDDDDELRGTLKKGLEQGGYAAVQAGSGEQAREILRRVRPDAVILDRMMTGGDGLSLLREMRAGGDKTPVVMLTAMGGEHAADGLEGGADDYMAKPFSLRELLLRIERLIRRDADARRDLPAGLSILHGEFIARGRPMPLNDSEAAALSEMLGGEIAPMAAMTAKRLREKIAAAGLGIDILTVRNKGYRAAF